MDNRKDLYFDSGYQILSGPINSSGCDFSQGHKISITVVGKLCIIVDLQTLHPNDYQ